MYTVLNLYVEFSRASLHFENSYVANLTLLIKYSHVYIHALHSCSKAEDTAEEGRGTSGHINYLVRFFAFCEWPSVTQIDIGTHVPVNKYQYGSMDLAETDLF